MGDTKEAWNEKDQTITVAEGNGFLYSLTLRAKVNSAPSDIYHILTDPNTVSIFRSIKECTYRRVLEDDGKGRRKLEVGHRALARFLFINVTFIKFQMARPGMMQKFDGCWRIAPFTQETLDGIYHPERLQEHHHHHHHGLHLGPLSASGLFGFLHPHKQPEATESLVTLEQCILPRGHTPPGVKGLVRGLCAHQIRTMMEDLRKELQRRKDGTSTTVRPKQLAVGEPLGAVAKGRTAAVAPAASMTLAGLSLWDHVSPINITIQL
ncbi:hypothetical protein GPECTOR_127g533 [Gonium pectorale]|uniref:Coenzyme Q-binding protein COQ10 START domain-containing protein n=1 Tax=Gonium pectorale TaxID=33097 RepID=A0A150FZK8_GONPE|nr:hypothetical protein GPECTOR_127g533 [Gonium pectorale]|eukprot:KXZ42655.1 hypothetical protein GPECTOR_127g533 [Gonium pectorale]